MENRTTKIFYNGEWTVIPFDHLKKGDTFKLIEANGEVVMDSNEKTEFIATSEPYINDDGVWTVQCE
ncbi:MAG TPA: hypothetical protein VK190_02920 [Pseudoneobacillus sp.]|jgi:hypothetical protein|nr:hypothetical protein [Pseudoneobacillus sp.]